MTRLLAVLALCSAAAVAYGFWMAWPPLGFIVGGLEGIAAAYVTAYLLRPASDR